MAKMNKELASVAAVLYELIDENRENDEMLNKLAIITYYFFQHHDVLTEGEGAFFELDEWISLLVEKNAGKNPDVAEMADGYGAGILQDSPEMVDALSTMRKKDE